MRRRLLRVSTSVVFGGMVIAGVIGWTAYLLPAYAIAQRSERPPVPPALRQEARSQTEIFSASNPSCPVLASGTVALGRTTSGEGSLTLRNLSAKPVAAINGTMVYETTGSPFSYPWSQDFLPSIAQAGRALPAGQEISVPLFPLNVPTGGGQINRAAVSVTGVVYADGTVCGETGGSLRDKFLAKAKAAAIDLERVLAAYEKVSQQAFEQLIKSGPVQMGQRWLNLLLKKELLDEGGRLRADALERLKTMKANLENPFGK